MNNDLNNADDTAFDLLESLIRLSGPVTLSLWRRRCQNFGIDEINMAKIKFEVDGIFTFADDPENTRHHLALNRYRKNTERIRQYIFVYKI